MFNFRSFIVNCRFFCTRDASGSHFEVIDSLLSQTVGVLIVCNCAFFSFLFVSFLFTKGTQEDYSDRGFITTDGQIIAFTRPSAPSNVYMYHLLLCVRN